MGKPLTHRRKSMFITETRMIQTARQLCFIGSRALRHTISCVALSPRIGSQLSSTHPQLPYKCQCSGQIHTTTTHWSTGHNPEPGRMKVISIPNPFRWLHNQLELATLKREWDPDFSAENFKAGVKQAVGTVTELASRREWGELRGLLSQKAIDKLRTNKWTPDQANNLVILPQRIQVTQIDNVNLQIIVDRRYCDIDVTVIGTREPYNLDKHSVIMLEYFARFHREYTDGVLPEWTITVFKLKNFEAYKRAGT